VGSAHSRGRDKKKAGAFGVGGVFGGSRRRDNIGNMEGGTGRGGGRGGDRVPRSGSSGASFARLPRGKPGRHGPAFGGFVFVAGLGVNYGHFRADWRVVQLRNLDRGSTGPPRPIRGLYISLGLLPKNWRKWPIVGGQFLGRTGGKNAPPFRAGGGLWGPICPGGDFDPGIGRPAGHALGTGRLR